MLADGGPGHGGMGGSVTDIHRRGRTLSRKEQCGVGCDLLAGVARVPRHPLDVLILTNGPGELATWVAPVVQSLRQQWGGGDLVRISVVLAPCAHASGQEVRLACQMPVDRVQVASAFGPFLLWGKTAQAWDWRPRGIVVFLGGDQFAAVVIGKRLGYAIVTYGEQAVRWLPWIDHCGAASVTLEQRVPGRWRHKVTVVGDLMVEAQGQRLADLPLPQVPPGTPLIGLLPGSKPLKLQLGVPLMVAIADHLQTLCPGLKLVMPLAPTVSLATLAGYATPAGNPLLARVGGHAAQLQAAGGDGPMLVTEQGTEILIWTEFPAYAVLARCDLCLTTVGANTAELAALAVPMMVLLPTQVLEVMRAWDGIPGLLANVPGVGKGFAIAFNRWVLDQGLGWKAWPNIWAGREIVPELVGPLQPPAVAASALNLLQDTERLSQMRVALRQVRGQPGAAQRFVQLMGLALETVEA